MAERVVLATLDFDERGALRGVKAVEQSIGSLQRQTDTTAGAFTQRMFSMRSAAQAFLGGFTLAGAIVGLKNFTTEIAKTDTAFLQFSESVKTANRAVQDFFRPFVHEALLMAANGINAIGSAFGQFFATFKSGYDALGAKGKAAFWTLTALLGGKTGSGFAKSMLGMGGDTRAEAPGDLYGPFGPGYGPQRPDTRYDLEGRPFAPAAQRIDEGVNIKEFGYIDELRRKIDELTGSKLHLDEALAAMPEGLKDYITTGAEEATPALRDLTAEFEAATAGAQAFGSAMASAMFQAGTSLKEAMGDAMMSLAQTMTAYALASLAIGAIASTPWGFAIFGPPAQYFHAAAVFGVAAAGAFAAASALGARRGGGAVGSSAGAAGGAAAAAPGGGNNYSIYVTVEGSSNPEMFGRRAALSIKRALADGAAGGSF